MSINFYNEDVSLPKMKFSIVKKIIKSEVISGNQKLGNLNYIFCSDEHLLSINIQFLQHDYYTDVITFDYSERNIISGDIFISVDRVLNNSEIFREDFSSELVRVIFHGMLHLLGLKDKTKDEIDFMRKRESDLIKLYLEGVS